MFAKTGTKGDCVESTSTLSVRGSCSKVVVKDKLMICCDVKGESSGTYCDLKQTAFV